MLHQTVLKEFAELKEFATERKVKDASTCSATRKANFRCKTIWKLGGRGQQFEIAGVRDNGFKMEEMEVEYCSENSRQAERQDRGVKRTILEINEEEAKKEKLTRSSGSHKLTIHCITADTYAYNIIKKENPKGPHPPKRCRLASEEAERVIQAYSF